MTMYGRRTGVLAALLAAVISGQPAAPDAAERAPEQTASTVLRSDLWGQVNPDGIAAGVDLYRRWSGPRDPALDVPVSYHQAGALAGTTPAFGRVSLYGEWQPLIFANLRLQYDLYRFYGTNSALLSFPSAESPFDRRDVEALEGQEEAGYGNRVLIRPMLFAKTGPVIITNRTDLAYLSFSGRGPYFLDWTYETLLPDGGRVVENRTDILLEIRKGPGTETLLAGPFYDIMHASTGLKRNRIGGSVYAVLADELGPLRRPRVYGQAGLYLHDRNREGEAYAAIGSGFDFDF